MSAMARFADRVAIIIGATGGLGAELCAQYIADGGRAVAFARSEEKLRALKARHGDRLLSIVGDATLENDLNAAVQTAESAFGRIDHLFHAVGSITLKSLQATSLADFESAIKLNLTAPFLAMKAVLPGMLARRYGAVVCVSSAAASAGLVNHEALAAAKAGLEGLIRSAAMTYAKRGVRFNAVAPGLVNTPLAGFLFQNPAALKASVDMHPMGRTGEPADVAGAMLFLASDAAAWITGAVLPADGGLAAGRGR
jgi:NAD(P)-dependent dehydrogenase (short-subunit alcohol dehydrogenase family)